jgi:RNA polymerase sigma-70 factor, ECF subfamily
VPDHDPSRDHREQRFAVLYRQHYRSVWAYAVRRVECEADAADVVADVFTVAWRRLPEVPESPADLLWLYGVARRVVAGKRRSARRLRDLVARLQASRVVSSTAGDQLTDRLVDAISRLRPAEREALALVHWEELSHAEAASVLGCSANAVAIRVHRARQRLRQSLVELTEPEAIRPEPPRPEPTCPEAIRPDVRTERSATIVRESANATEG